MSQNIQKITSLMTSLTKNHQPPTKNFFFFCRLEDLPNLLRIWAALSRNWRRSNGVCKATKNCWFQADFQVRIYCTPALKVWNMSNFIKIQKVG